MEPLRVFIGYDEREAIAFDVLQHSIRRHASVPVSITAIELHQLRSVYSRSLHPLQSTAFSFSRFLVPYLSGYKGWSLFMDCDMLMLEDVAQLFALRNEQYAVMLVKHDHRPREQQKFLGNFQTAYDCKNWSSVMLMQNAVCCALDPAYVATAPGLDLHQFRWLGNPGMIGALPARWNHLVGYDAPRADAAVLHFTLGGPYFEEYAGCDYADVWRREYALLAEQWRHHK
jgi:hypothetical protein